MTVIIAMVCIVVYVWRSLINMCTTFKVLVLAPFLCFMKAKAEEQNQRIYWSGTDSQHKMCLEESTMLQNLEFEHFWVSCPWNHRTLIRSRDSTKYFKAFLYLWTGPTQVRFNQQQGQKNKE